MAKGVKHNGLFETYNTMLSVRNDRKLQHVSRKSKLNDLLGIVDVRLNKLVRRGEVLNMILDSHQDMSRSLFNYLSEEIQKFLIDTMLYEIYQKIDGDRDLEWSYNSALHYKKLHGSGFESELYNKVISIYKTSQGMKMSDTLNL
jgi:hypothetical protein